MKKRRTLKATLNGETRARLPPSEWVFLVGSGGRKQMWPFWCGTCPQGCCPVCEINLAAVGYGELSVFRVTRGVASMLETEPKTMSDSHQVEPPFGDRVKRYVRIFSRGRIGHNPSSLQKIELVRAAQAELRSIGFSAIRRAAAMTGCGRSIRPVSCG